MLPPLIQTDAIIVMRPLGTSFLMGIKRKERKDMIAEQQDTNTLFKIKFTLIMLILAR